MKSLIATLILGLPPLSAHAQDVPKPAVLSGSFAGVLDASDYGGERILTVFHVGPPPSLDALQSGLAGIPLTLKVTGKGDAERITSAGCDGYIAKPMAYREFLSTVARFLPA